MRSLHSSYAVHCAVVGGWGILFLRLAMRKEEEEEGSERRKLKESEGYHIQRLLSSKMAAAVAPFLSGCRNRAGAPAPSLELEYNASLASPPYIAVARGDEEKQVQFLISISAKFLRVSFDFPRFIT